MNIKNILFFLFICVSLLFTACTTGVYVKAHSTAPEWGPVFIGMKREDAERHLGLPMFISRLNENQYSCIYEYHISLGPKDILSFDVMDFTTFGLGTLIISPVDRAKRSRHLIAVIYQMDDKIMSDDRVIGIKEKVKVSMQELHLKGYVTRSAGERDYIPYVSHAGNELNEALKPQTETGMGG
ncbi:MAG: hypothetical protein GX846_11345 [Deltaproteobacteria bacterium]|nr:hypothetical protein [Deltaproteobacteria bacterium]